MHEAASAPCPDGGTCQLRPTFFFTVFTQGPHAMADDTRVTHSRSGIACTLVLLWVLGCTLPAQALAGDIVVRRDAGLSAAERTAVRADAGVKLERILTVDNTEVVTVPDGGEKRALAALDANPDVRYAVPDVRLHAADTEQIT